MNWALLYILLAACAISMVCELLGAPMTLALNFKGDVKRETRWLAQYGQAICTAIAALLVWRLDDSPAHARAWQVLLVAVFATSLIATIIKRLLGRVRPNRERAGRFLGPTFRHANYRESFPSSHSASAFALSVALAAFYPRGAEIFWGLAAACALLRYIMDAHWPSDIFGGVALGYGIAHLTCHLMMYP